MTQKLHKYKTNHNFKMRNEHFLATPTNHTHNHTLQDKYIDQQNE